MGCPCPARASFLAVECLLLGPSSRSVCSSFVTTTRMEHLAGRALPRKDSFGHLTMRGSLVAGTRCLRPFECRRRAGRSALGIIIIILFHTTITAFWWTLSSALDHFPYRLLHPPHRLYEAQLRFVIHNVSHPFCRSPTHLDCLPQSTFHNATPRPSAQ